jgi:hypothetical protein
MKTLGQAIKDAIDTHPDILNDNLIGAIMERLQDCGIYASYSTTMHTLRGMGISVRTVSKPRPAGRKPGSPRQKMRTWG